MEDVRIEEFSLGCTKNVYLSPVIVTQTGSVYQVHLGQPCLGWQHEEFQMGACGRATPPNTHTDTCEYTHIGTHILYHTHATHAHIIYLTYHTFTPHTHPTYCILPTYTTHAHTTYIPYTCISHTTYIICMYK